MVRGTQMKYKVQHFHDSKTIPLVFSQDFQPLFYYPISNLYFLFDTGLFLLFCEINIDIYDLF